MTRPFGLRDLGLVWSLRGCGITLDMQRAALWPSRPIGAALSGLLPPGHAGATMTYVCDGDTTNQRGFIQVLTCPERQEWQVIHLAPWPEGEGTGSSEGWAGALGDLCSLAGAQGALRIRAGVAEGSGGEAAFRQAGFAAYAREAVYRLSKPEPRAEAGRGLRSLSAVDAWPLLQLMGQVVPPAVQHAEGLALSSPDVPVLARLGANREQGYVLERGTDLGAYVGLSRGAQGAWARILLHPEARGQAVDVVWQAIAAAVPARALFCAVREYQSGLRGLLEGLGFEFVGVQVWLVKHTARPAECLRHRYAVAHDARVEPATTPLHPVNDVTLRPCSPSMREQWMYEHWRADTYAFGSD